MDKFVIRGGRPLHGSVEISGAKNATLSLTKRLAKQVAKLQSREHSTTWVDYGTRGHYASDDLTRKSEMAAAFVAGAEARNRLVLDVGGTVVVVLVVLVLDVVGGCGQAGTSARHG